MTGRHVRLLTIRGPHTDVDLVVAADTALQDVTPLLVELAGDGRLDRDDPRWGLFLPDGSVLDRNASLGDLGVLDGATVHLHAPPARWPGGTS
jgi:hypothetical protein